MAYALIYPDSYIKRARKFLKRHPELLKQYEKTLQLLELNPFHPSLKLHKLTGSMSGLSAVSINIGYRIALEFEITEDRIVLVNIGSHDEVYQR